MIMIDAVLLIANEILRFLLILVKLQMRFLLILPLKPKQRTSGVITLRSPFYCHFTNVFYLSII